MTEMLVLPSDDAQPSLRRASCRCFFEHVDGGRDGRQWLAQLVGDLRQEIGLELTYGFRRAATFTLLGCQRRESPFRATAGAGEGARRHGDDRGDDQP